MINFVVLCALAYAFPVHFLPACGEAAICLAKAMKENFENLILPSRFYVVNLQELLRMISIRCITGRPQEKPPDLTFLLPGFS